MLPPKRHLLSIAETNHIEHPIRILRHPPKGPVLDLGDSEVHRLGGSGIDIPDHDADDAVRGEMLGRLAGYYVAGPVGGFVHDDGLEGAWHCALDSRCPYMSAIQYIGAQ